jgi:hypothetical protein
MRSEPFDHNSFMFKADSGYHSVSVSFDIENDPAAGYDVCASEISFQSIEILPFCFSHSLKPGCQIGF